MVSQVDTETMETRRLQATRGSRGVIRAPQSLAGGLLLVALAALALWLTRDLDQGTLNAMGQPCCRAGWPSG